MPHKHRSKITAQHETSSKKRNRIGSGTPQDVISVANKVGSKTGFFKQHWKFLVTSIISLLGALCGTLALSVNGCNNAKVACSETHNYYYNISVSIDSKISMQLLTGDNAKARCVDDEVLTLPSDPNHPVTSDFHKRDAPTTDTQPTPVPKYVVVNNTTELDEITENIRFNYERGDYTNATLFAVSGFHIVEKVLKDVSGQPFSIEIKCVQNITKIYCMLAEEAWGRKEYLLANVILSTAIRLWNGEPPGDLVAMKVAIEIQQSGQPMTIFNDEIMRYAQSRNKTFMQEYIRRLKSWGYIHDVAVDVDTHEPVYFYYKNIFKIPGHVMSPMILRTDVPSKDGRKNQSSELISLRYIGMGKQEGVAFPRPKSQEEEFRINGTKHKHVLLFSTAPLSAWSNSTSTVVRVLKKGCAE